MLLDLNEQEHPEHERAESIRREPRNSPEPPEWSHVDLDTEFLAHVPDLAFDAPPTGRDIGWRLDLGTVRAAEWLGAQKTAGAWEFREIFEQL